MSNQRYGRKIKLLNAKEAELRAGKKAMGSLYFTWKQEVTIGLYPSMEEVRKSLVALMVKVNEVIAWSSAKLPYLRALEIMLDKLGGAGEEDVGWKAIHDELHGPNGPSQESIMEAMKQLGMEPPATGPGSPSATAATPPEASEAAAGAPAPRFHRSYPDLPPPRDAGSEAPPETPDPTSGLGPAGGDAPDAT